jgi:hypothetical protein
MNVRCSIDSYNNVVNEFSIDAESIYDGDLQIDLSTVSQGVHRLYIQVLDENLRWTHYASHLFVVAGKLGMETLSSVEYFFDADPGIGNGYLLFIPNEATADVQLDLAIPDDLSLGIHRLYLRVLDGGNQVSHYYSGIIEIAGNTAMLNLAGMEYFFDTDPGFGNAFWLPLPQQNLIDENLNLPVPEIVPLGNHIMYIRCSDGEQWSHYDALAVTICETYAPTAAFLANRFQGGTYMEFYNTSELAETHTWIIDGVNAGNSDSLLYLFDEPGQYQVCIEASNSCGDNAYCETISVNGISDFFAQQGNNSSAVSVTIRGGFVPGAEVRLIREGFEDIVSEEVLFINESELRVLFDLRGQAIGLYNLQVDMNEEGLFIADEAFEIIEGEPAAINVELIGIRLSRAGREEPYHLVIENFGDEDAVAVPVLIRQVPVDVATLIPGDSLVTIETEEFAFFDGIITEQINTGFDPALISPYMKNPMDDTYGYGYIIPQVPAGGSVSLDFTINSDAPGFEFNGRTSFFPWLKSTAVLQGESDLLNPHCRSVEFKQILEELSGAEISDLDWDNCFESAYQEATGFLASLAQQQGYNTSSLVPLPAYNGAILLSCAGCLGLSLDEENWTYALGRFDRLSKFMTVEYSNCDEINPELLPLLERLTQDSQSAERTFNCAPGGGGGGGFNSGAFMGGLNPANREAFENLCRNLSSDPNTKEGPIANGAWINNVRNIPYQIWFENEESATAPAQLVVVRDTLDADKFNFQSFEWLGFGFSGLFFDVPQGRKEHYEIIDLRPEIPNLLKFTASFDESTGIAEAHFATLDTIILELTSNALEGFLPPNLTHPEGQGFVAFRLDNADDLQAGDLITNTAEIIFDYNDAIITSPWDLYFDDIAPTAQFTGNTEVFQSTFNLTWDEFDTHSGVEHIEIYLIENGEAQLFAIADNDALSLEVNASFGSVLEFGILAYDFAGNVQDNMDVIEVSIIDGVLENALSDLVIYPNPTQGIISVAANNMAGQFWTICDLKGRTIKTGVFNSDLSRIDVSYFAGGVYMLQVKETRILLVKE